MFEHYADGDVFDSSVRARLGAAVGQRARPVGTEGHRGVHRHPRPADRAGGDQGASGQGQRDRPRRAARPGQGDELMSANLARTADGWWLVTPAGLIRLGLTAPTTAALLAGRPALDTAVETARLAAAAAPARGGPGRVPGPAQPGDRARPDRTGSSAQPNWPLPPESWRGCGGTRSAWRPRPGWPPCSSVRWSPTDGPGTAARTPCLPWSPWPSPWLTGDRTGWLTRPARWPASHAARRRPVAAVLGPHAAPLRGPRPRAG